MRTFIVFSLLTIFITQIQSASTPNGFISRNISEATTNATIQAILVKGIEKVKEKNVDAPLLNLTNIHSVASSNVFVPDISSDGKVRGFVSGIAVQFDVTLVDPIKNRVFNVVMLVESKWDANKVELTYVSRY